MKSEFAIAVVKGAFGVGGDCKVESISGEYSHIENLQAVVLCRDGKRKSCVVERAEMKGSFLSMKFKGIDTPEQARELSRSQIIVPREQAKPLAEDEWYVEDLAECLLCYEGVAVGAVKSVVEGGGGDLLEVALLEDCPLVEASVKYSSAGKLRTVFVPFKNEYVGKVDVEGKKIELLHLWILE